MTDIHTDRLLAALPAPNEAAFFFDFDGTLVDLAPTPDGIYVPEELPADPKEASAPKPSQDTAQPQAKPSIRRQPQAARRG